MRILLLTLTFCIVFFLKAPVLYGQPQWNDLKNYQRELYNDIVDGKPINFTDQNFLYLGGLSSFLLEQCNLNLSFKEENILKNFINACGYFVELNCSLNLETVVDRAEIFKEGKAVAEVLTCKEPYATDLAKSIIYILQTQEEDSIFIKSCKPYQNDKKCKCLAKLAMGIYPNIHELRYSYDLVKSIIDCNVFFAIQILSCGITRY